VKEAAVVSKEVKEAAPAAPKEAAKESKKEEPKANGVAAAAVAAPKAKPNRGWGTVQKAPAPTEVEGDEPTPAEAAAAKGKKVNPTRNSQSDGFVIQLPRLGGETRGFSVSEP
jgi:hypothetical protein